MHKRYQRTILIVILLVVVTAISIIAYYFITNKDRYPATSDSPISQDNETTNDGISQIDDIATPSLEDINNEYQDDESRFTRLLSAAQERLYVQDYSGALNYYTEAESLEKNIDIQVTERISLYWSLSAVYGELDQEEQRIIYADKAGELENDQ